MDFFENQDRARRNTYYLIGMFLIALVVISAATAGAFMIGWNTTVLVEDRNGASLKEFAIGFNWEAFFLIFSGTFVIISLGSLWKFFTLNKGGMSIALMLDGRIIPTNTREPNEKRLLNIVEEMSIASGVPAPPVLLMEKELSINAFAAGFRPDDAVIGVSKGSLELLSRDELQGVIAHEFSHILNGDMKLNLRLLAIVYGILVITITGRLLLHSSSRRRRYRGGGYFESSSSSNRNQKDSILPIVGLALIAIGYIGVLAGKLIKSAISRQREFLADAAAVQFTRNPEGIGGALKKIGGLSYGSEIMNEHAEELSHFFFANGLRSSFLGMFATHPPLIERIKRIDPHFKGEYKPIDYQSVSHDDASGISNFQSGASTTAGDDPTETPSAEAVADQVGVANASHLSFARKIHASLPKELQALVHEPYGARAVVYGLLLSKESGVQEAQLKRLFQHGDAGIHKVTLQIAPHILDIGPEYKVPLVDLLVPALRNLSRGQFIAFRENVRYLAKADDKCSLFEYVLQMILLRHLEPTYGLRKKEPIRFHEIDRLAPYAFDLFFHLAVLGNKDAKVANDSFQAAVESFPSKVKPKVDFSAKCSLSSLDKILSDLERASPKLKKEILKGAVVTITADKRITVEEAELIRAIADSLDMPLPPLMASEL